MDGSIRLQQFDDHSLITIRGFLDQELANNLKAQVQKASPPIILDFKQVSHVTPDGSQALINLYQLHQQKPAIRYANQDIISFLKLSGAARYIEWLDTDSFPLTSQE